jgi:hypothetical protein
MLNLDQWGTKTTPESRAVVCNGPVIAEVVPGTVDVAKDVRRAATLLKANALQNAILNSANF